MIPRSSSRTLARSSVLALALSAAFSTSCHKPEAPAASAEAQAPANEVWLTDAQIKEAKIEITSIEEQEVDDVILTSGRVTFDDMRVAHVFSPVTGRINKIVAPLGQRVRKGDPLAVIESPDVGIASSDLSKAQADLVAAEHDYKRVKGLFDSHAASEREVEQAEDAWRKARAELERSRQKANLLKGGSVDMVTQSFTLTSGIEGEVIGRNVNMGMEVQGQYGGGNAVELFTIGELDRVWVVADVYELDMARVKVGSPVAVKSVAYPDRKPFEGKIEWIAGVLDKETRTAKMRCSFDNADRALKPEMFVTVSLQVDQKRVLALPRNALMRLGDVTVVFIESGKAPDGRTKFERVPLAVDEGEGGKWIPLSGPGIPKRLAKGVRIVSAGGVLLSTSG
jgi:cobalt-zinc-cadmium efflux system membrane fusion protein